MRHRLLSSFAALVLTAVGVTAASAAQKPAHNVWDLRPAAIKAHIYFKPSSIRPKSAAQIHGSGLKPNTFYFLTIAVPNFAHHSDERLFGPVKTDGHGNLNAPVAIPPIFACGKASVRAYPTGSKSYVATTVKVLGCGKPNHAPPPAPRKTP